MSDARSWLAPWCALALAGCAGGPADQPRDAARTSSPPARGLARREAEAAVTEMLQGMIDSIGAMKQKYPELAEWDLREPETHGRGCSFHYSFRDLRREGKTPRVRFGRHGCDLGVTVGFGDYDAVPRALSKRWFPNVGVGICFWIRRSRTMSSRGFGKEMGAIYERFVRSLEALDRRAAWRRPALDAPLENAPSAEEVQAAVDEALQGMIEDITVLKAKYPELAEWDVKAPVNGGFMYHYHISYATDPPEVGAHGCNIGAWIRPEPNPPPLLRLPGCRFPSLGILGHTWINAGEKGTPGFCAEVQSIFTRRMAAIEELEWRETSARGSAAARREP